MEERQEIDRWIISKLNSVIKGVHEDYATYEPTAATRRIQNFVDRDLSNWYVRRNRKRFWSESYSQDELGAYQTLYDCLIAVAKMMSPVAPFFSDWLYQNLNNITQKEPYDSVHLAAFPVVDEALIDRDLETKMDYAQRISSLVLSLRKNPKINVNVRQPLQKILLPVIDENFQQQVEAVADVILAEVNVKEIAYVTDGQDSVIKKKVKPNFKTLGKRLGKHMKAAAQAINGLNQEDIATIEKTQQYTLEVGGESFVLTLEDFEILTEDIPGWEVANDGPITVALDVTINDDLKAEGMARELINRIQNIRKDKGFELTDRITIHLEKREEVVPAIEQFGTYISSETLANKLSLVEKVKGEETITLPEEVTLGIEVEKVSA